ncbi:MAG: hypothetical protein VX438_09425 [Planctomycetota bacterium]|nr:hypothetical protein [Planctomycetota bacterium]
MSESKKAKTAVFWFHWPVRAALLFLFVAAVLLFFADDTWRQASASIGPIIGLLSGVYVLANNAITYLEVENAALKAKLAESPDNSADESTFGETTDDPAEA